MSVQADPTLPAPRLRLRQYLPSLILLVLVATLLTVMWAYMPNFFRLNNIINILLQASILGLLVIGMTGVLITGGIDLSMPANMALAAVLGTMAMRSTGSAAIGPVVMLAVGLALGAVNAVAVARLKMIPFVVTLSTMTVVSGTCIWITNSVSITGLPPSYTHTLLAKPFGIPVGVFAMVLFTVIASFVMQRCVPGRWLYTVGLNPRAARIGRVPVDRVIAGAYLAAGLMAGVTAVLLTARLGSASANMGADALTLDIIAACVVGGVSTFGGVGRAYGAVFGAILITVLSNVMNLAGVSFYVGLVIKGAVIVAFVAAEHRWRH